jgi:hypothetical protein
MEKSLMAITMKRWKSKGGGEGSLHSSSRDRHLLYEGGAKATTSFENCLCVSLHSHNGTLPFKSKLSTSFALENCTETRVGLQRDPYQVLPSLIP